MPRRIGAQWAILMGLSVALALGLEALRLPAAMLLGAMGAAVALSSAGMTLRVPEPAFLLAQALVGCLMARAIPLSIFPELAANWPIFLAGIVSVIAASNVLGWLLARWRVLPGTSAIWGASPGAGTAMVLMADAHGADARLVAVMQYLRVICVAVTASLVSRLWGAAPAAQSPMVWFPPVAWVPLLSTLALAGSSALVARRLRIPAGPLLLSLVAGVALQEGGWLTIDLPPWLLALGYAQIGWGIGLRFTRPILRYAARALPRILASTLVLIVLCGGFAALMVEFAGIDPLTAYLATSPGGGDSVAIIAASSAVDLPFVMAMQTARVVIVLLTGPALARFIAARVTTRR